MKAKTFSIVSAILVLVVAGTLSFGWGDTQVEPQKHKEPPTKNPPEPTTTTDQPGLGGLEDVDHMQQMMLADSVIQRMTELMKKSQSLSKSFAELAGAHHGADKSEILMMQRMSDSMGTMAGEVKTSLQQYKAMLEDETVSESGGMRTEIHGLRGVMNGIGSYIDEGLQTLQKLEEQLGQG
jgi:hypothetical protein